jgi:hypothetical protein
MKSTKHLTSIALAALLAAYAFGIVGCSSSDGSNPMDPGNSAGGSDTLVVKQPKSLKINNISVSAFGDKNGGVWDATISVSGRRPDIYVQYRIGSNTAAPDFVSITEDDAFSGAPYNFTESKSGKGYHLPRTVSAGSKIYVNLMDSDWPSADDEIGSFSFRPSDYYKDDNAVGFYKVFFGSNSTKISVSGTWVY